MTTDKESVILYYDMFLTFADEVQYAWQAPKKRGAWLFLLNRYFTPITVSHIYAIAGGIFVPPLTPQQDIFVFVANFTSLGSAEVCRSDAFAKRRFRVLDASIFRIANVILSLMKL